VTSIAVRSQESGGASLTSPLIRAIESTESRLTLRAAAHQVFIDNALAQERLIAMVAALFGTLAIMLAVVSLCGVMTHTVNRRRSEIGVRLALGAARRRFCDSSCDGSPCW
jgi:hypothetical protein